MTDTVKSWIEERRAVRARAEYDREYACGTHRAVAEYYNMFPRALNALEQVLELLDGWEPPDPCMGPDITKCVDCLQIQEMRRAIEGAINE